MTKLSLTRLMYHNFLFETIKVITVSDITWQRIPTQSSIII